MDAELTSSSIASSKNQDGTQTLATKLDNFASSQKGKTESKAKNIGTVILLAISALKTPPTMTNIKTYLSGAGLDVNAHASDIKRFFSSALKTGLLTETDGMFRVAARRRRKSSGKRRSRRRRSGGKSRSRRRKSSGRRRKRSGSRRGRRRGKKSANPDDA